MNEGVFRVVSYFNADALRLGDAQTTHSFVPDSIVLDASHFSASSSPSSSSSSADEDRSSESKAEELELELEHELELELESRAARAAT